MAETFEAVWRRARAEAPSVPPLMIRGWAQEAYTKACDFWGWSFLRAEGIITTLAQRTVTVGATYGSTTVTSAAAFVSTDAGRQIRMNPTATLGRIPIYTIKDYVDASTVTLDLPYADDTNAAIDTAIFDAYFTCPTDFRRFLVIYDRYYLRTIPFWIPEDELAVADPGRVFSDQGPRYLIARKYSSATATLGQVQYEYWPAPTSARVYPYLYIRGADTLNDTSVLPGVFAQRSDLLKTYILSRACLWPGTSDSKNALFSPAAAKLYADEWQAELQRLSLVDDGEYPQQLMTIHWMRRMGSIAPTGTLLRQTDASINDYF